MLYGKEYKQIIIDDLYDTRLEGELKLHRLAIAQGPKAALDLVIELGQKEWDNVKEKK